MLKKAGIVVAAAAAGLLAVSPLAFAGDKGGWDHGHDSNKSVNYAEGDSSQGLVNVSGNNVNVPVQACNNDIPVAVAGIGAAVPVQKVAVPLSAALGILGDATGGDSEVNSVDGRSCNVDGGAGDSVSQSND